MGQKLDGFNHNTLLTSRRNVDIADTRGCAWYGLSIMDERMRNPRNIVLLGFVLALCGFGLYGYQSLTYAHWVSVRAQVVHTKLVYERPASRNYHCSTWLETLMYSVSGVSESIQKQDTYCPPREPAVVHGYLGIRYDPSDPSNVVLESTVRDEPVLLVVGILGLLLLGFGWWRFQHRP